MIENRESSTIAAAGGAPAPAAPRRILIVRPDHLGDLVLFTGALRQIRRQWPEAHITLCVRSYGRQLYGGCPYIDRLYPYEQLRKASPINRIPYFPGSRQVCEFLREHLGEWLYRHWRPAFLSDLACDLAILPLRSPEEEYPQLMRLIPASAKLSIAGGAFNQTPENEIKARAFYKAQLDASGLPVDYPEFRLTADFLRFMGVDAQPEDLWPELWTTDPEKQAARAWIDGATRTLAIAPGNVILRKRMPPDWYVKVIGRLASGPVRVVLLGSPSDAEACAALETALAGARNVTGVLNLAGRTTVGQMIECIRQCDALLTQETAALHIATALRRPVAGIVGGGHFGRFFPWGDPKLARTLTVRMECFYCEWQCKYDTMRCIQEIPPADAGRELDALMGTAAGAEMPAPRERLMEKQMPDYSRS